MALVVQKFGGTSVGSIERIRNVAKRAIATQKEGNDVVVIVSAMSGETNRLLKLAHEVVEFPEAREMDVIAATGEQITSALLSLAIQAEGGQARSLLGHQVKILTDGAFTKARIKTIEGSKIFSTVKKGQIAVVAGFQGVDEEGNITTLGRGGSDTTAVAVAAAIGADACEIYTDVDGVFTSDPRIVPKAHKIDAITSEEMLELAANGAVEPIGGIKQKTIGVKEAGADVFLVPAGDNAAQARKEAGDLRIIPVKTFPQALHALATLPPEQ